MIRSGCVPGVFRVYGTQKRLQNNCVPGVPGDPPSARPRACVSYVRARSFSRARITYSSRVHTSGNTRNTRNNQLPQGFQRSGYLEQTRNSTRNPEQAAK